MTTTIHTTVTFRCIVCNVEETVRAEAFMIAPWHCVSPMMKVA